MYGYVGLAEKSTERENMEPSDFAHPVIILYDTMTRRPEIRRQMIKLAICNCPVNRGAKSYYKTMLKNARRSVSGSNPPLTEKQGGWIAKVIDKIFEKDRVLIDRIFDTRLRERNTVETIEIEAFYIDETNRTRRIENESRAA